MDMKRFAAWASCGILVSGVLRAEQASPPQALTISIYDTGFALVNENRRVTLAKGESEVVVRQIPSQVDAATCALSLLSGGGRLDLLDMRFENDLANDRALFDRFVGKLVTVDAGGRPATGRLLAGPRRTEAKDDFEAIALSVGEGGARVFLQPDRVSSVDFPRADESAYLEPTLVWRVRSEQEGLQNVRLTYLAAGLSWRAEHAWILSPDGSRARISTRAGIRNLAGGRFTDARVRLLATEQGMTPEGDARQYAYGRPEAVSEPRGSTVQVRGSYEVPIPVSLADGQERYFELATVDDLAVTRFCVYDGVRFDRYPRNPKTDWSYGTESSRTVDLHVEASLPERAGRLPGGPVRIYQSGADGGLDFLGRNAWAEPDESRTLRARVGPARGLSGERERVNFAEVRPQREYTETFEIRLSNLSDQPAEIRVVEHLYRSPDYEIARADSEYISPAPQTIEFRPTVKPGGRQTIRYTVRYRW